jgi:uncharacterized protein (DUF362 family)
MVRQTTYEEDALRSHIVVLTRPFIVRCVAEYVLARRARPLVADSPAIGSFDMILRMSGIRGYHCLEVCPPGALHATETLTGRTVRHFAERILQPGRPATKSS